MTKEQKAKYLKNKGVICPYCGDSQIDSGKPEISEYSDEIHCLAKCGNCKKTWTDIYQLTDTDFEPS